MRNILPQALIALATLALLGIYNPQMTLWGIIIAVAAIATYFLIESCLKWCKQIKTSMQNNLRIAAERADLKKLLKTIVIKAKS
ncbi:MAG: ABC-type bacteriocin/lantibiotic exporter with double-glycine peptidase domain [Alphaproteobacteria bacterium]|jgi:ABC-type bacteriocin/lantibiotic exporter with double-glycine peptidase domain